MLQSTLKVYYFVLFVTKTYLHLQRNNHHNEDGKQAQCNHGYGHAVSEHVPAPGGLPRLETSRDRTGMQRALKTHYNMPCHLTRFDMLSFYKRYCQSKLYIKFIRIWRSIIILYNMVMLLWLIIVHSFFKSHTTEKTRDLPKQCVF